MTVFTRCLIILFLIVTAIILSGCLPGTLPGIAIITPTPSPSPVMDDATLLSVALENISGDQNQYSLENLSHPKIDKNLTEELNKLLTNRAFKEAFVSKFEVINAIWLTPNDNPDMEDVLLMINCNGSGNEDCTTQKTTSETILDIIRNSKIGSC